MSANTETTGGPPKGYVECEKGCGRYAGVGNWCWECRAKERPIGLDEREVTMLAYPDWTPPSAAPAAQVERRKGQVWRCAWDGQVVEATIIDGRTDLGTWPMSDDDYWCDSRWTGRGSIGSRCIMTLLADATPEPAKRHQKALACDHCQAMQKVEPDCDAVMCAVCFAAGHSLRTKFPPAHEAPKAAPVCTNGRDCPSPEAPVLMRVLRDERQLMCDGCYLGVEYNLERLMAFERSGKPYAGPERLPKPQLAADWVEDCLGDVR